MARFSLFVVAVIVLYIGGFVYEHIGPVFYGLIITLIASTPLLFKASFWKKIILMVPLLVLRVIGKIFLIVFGKNALSKLLAKYGLLERRFNRVIETFEQSKNQGIYRWKSIHRSTQAYLVLIFFPVVLVILVVALLIKIVRLRFLQFMIEKLMQKYFMKWTSKAQSKLAQSKSSGAQRLRSHLEGTSQKASNSKDAQGGRLGSDTIITSGHDHEKSGDR